MKILTDLFRITEMRQREEQGNSVDRFVGKIKEKVEWRIE